MEVEYQGKKWTVIKEYPKKRKEKDLLLCVDKYGIKECFQRCQLSDLPDYRVKKRVAPILPEMRAEIEELILNGATRNMILNKYKDVAVTPLYELVRDIRKKHNIKSHHFQNDEGAGREVLQYDHEMNFIAKYPSAYRAQRETSEKEWIIKNMCNKKEVKKSKFVWRWADDQQ